MPWHRDPIQLRNGNLNSPHALSPSPSAAPHGSLHRESLHPWSSSVKISPAVLFVIVILAALFFISGLLHLLVRFLLRHRSPPSPRSNRYPEVSTSDALQRQLQQLFHLHDSGLDQAFIDALPVFQYREIVGLKEPFDCAVCLCEFSEKDKLRLLPMCSHAFHISCIDTWLLSNSTCPLCRGSLFAPEFSVENPIFELDDSREEEGCPVDGESRCHPRPKTVEIEEVVVEKGILPVRLGKFRRSNEEDEGEAEVGGQTSSSRLDGRRCFSMGSYQYVLGNSDLRVAFSHGGQLCDDKPTDGTEQTDMEAKKMSSVSKGDSYSVSKIWLWSKKGKFSSSSDAHRDISSSLSAELPWMKKKPET